MQEEHEVAVLQLGPASKKEEEKELTYSLPAFRVSYVKRKSPQMRRNLRFQGARLWAFLLLMLCSSGKTAFCRADGCASPSGWESLYPTKLHDHPARKDSLQSGQRQAAVAEV